MYWKITNHLQYSSVGNIGYHLKSRTLAQGEICFTSMDAIFKYLLQGTLYNLTNQST